MNGPMWGTLGTIWGIGGVLLILGSAVWRLAPVGREALDYPLGTRHWIFLAVWIALMLWSEGYRGFHRNFSPRVAARARYLRDHPHPLHLTLAPLFCFGFLHATRRRRLTSTAVVLGIFLLVVAVRRLPQPWRGLIDIGVALGLVAGIASVVYFAVRALGAQELPVSPEVPEEL